MKKIMIAIAGAGLLASACASDPYGNTNQTVRQGAIGAAIGGAIGAIRGSSQDRNNQQRYRAANGQYYYCYDNRQTECYWEDGTRVRW